jgi:hypothetical protein
MRSQSAISNGPDSIINVGVRILTIRGHRVLLDADLAELYGVPTKGFNQSVRRNAHRFPEDFMFRLTGEEFENLRSQFVTSRSWGGRRYPPLAFTEQGVAMLSSVLNSDRAIRVNIAIMRTFMRLRGIVVSNEELARKLAVLERKYDAQFKVVFDAIREMMMPPVKAKRRIGFHAD